LCALQGKLSATTKDKKRLVVVRGIPAKDIQTAKRLAAEWSEENG